jgi:hypothetical protein
MEGLTVRLEAVPTEWDEPAQPHPVATAPESVGGARRARDLPEAKQLVELGYHLMDPDAVRMVLLTALWPPEHRTWVPDRTERTERRWRSDGWTDTQPLSDETRNTVDDEVDDVLRAAGVSPRPRGRLWFVRLPRGRKSVARYQASLQRRVDRAGVPDDGPGPDWAALVRDLIAEDFAPGSGRGHR